MIMLLKIMNISLLITTSTSLCTDSNTNCAHWAGLNYCTLYVDYMTKSCKKSCNICGSSCTDSNKNCADWAGKNYCTEKYVAYVTENCKKSCNICGSSPAVAPTKAPTSTSSCTDSGKYCAKYAGLNYCTEKYVDWMTENCKKSCNICRSSPTVAPTKAPTSTSSCTDSNTNCAYWAGLNYCTEKHVDYMTKTCKKSCNICGSSPTVAPTKAPTKAPTSTSSCTDSSKSCAYWAGLNYCTEKHVDYMTKTCKKSCNICGSSCTDSNKNCAYYAGKNYCTEKHVDYMTKTCKKSCNIC